MTMAALSLESSAAEGGIVLMPVGGLIGLLGDRLGAAGTVLLLGLLSLLAAASVRGLSEVSH